MKASAAFVDAVAGNTVCPPSLCPFGSPLLDGWDGSDNDEDDDDHPYQGPRTKSPLPKTRPNSAPSKQPKGKRNKLQASVSAGKLLQAAREVSAEKPWRRRPPSAPPKRRPPPPPPKPDPPWKRETKSGWARAAVEKDPASHKRQPPSPPKGEGLVRVPKPKPVSSSSQQAST